jgi:hypothetical protein
VVIITGRYPCKATIEVTKMFHLRPRKNNLTENNGCKDNRQELTAMRKLIERLDLEGRLRRENMHRYFLQCTLAGLVVLVLLLI